MTLFLVSGSSAGIASKHGLPHELDEEGPLLLLADGESPAKKRRPRLSNREKFSLAFDYITTHLNLSISHFLWELFLYEDEGRAVKRTSSHDSAVSIFISGSSKYTVPQVLEQILKFPASTPTRGSVEMQDDMFSLTKTWSSIKRIKPALTTLAVELVTDRLAVEVEAAVQSSSGLYGSVPPLRPGQRKSIGWMDISKNTPSTTQGIFQMHCPVTLHVLGRLVSRQESHPGAIIARKMRPPELVSKFHTFVSLLLKSHFLDFDRDLKYDSLLSNTVCATPS